MFAPEDFQLSLESELKLRVIRDEIDQCKDISELQQQLKAATELMMKYQTILNRLLQEKITENLSMITDKIEKLFGLASKKRLKDADFIINNSGPTEDNEILMQVRWTPRKDHSGLDTLQGYVLLLKSVAENNEESFALHILHSGFPFDISIIFDVDDVALLYVGQGCLKLHVIRLQLWERDDVFHEAGDAVFEETHIDHHVIDGHEHGFQHVGVLEKIHELTTYTILI